MLIAVSLSVVAVTFSAELTKAVLHDWAKLSAKSTVPSTWSSAFLKRLPLTRVVFGQSREVVGAMPDSTIAAPETTLNTDPGGYCPVSARSQAAPFGSALATASTLPSLGRIATIAVGFFAVFAASSAAVCTATSIVVDTSLPGRPATVCSVVGAPPEPESPEPESPVPSPVSALTARIRSPGAGRSVPS